LSSTTSSSTSSLYVSFNPILQIILPGIKKSQVHKIEGGKYPFDPSQSSIMLSKESNVERDSIEMNLNGSLSLHQDGHQDLLFPRIVLENDFSKNDGAIHFVRFSPERNVGIERFQAFADDIMLTSRDAESFQRNANKINNALKDINQNTKMSKTVYVVLQFSPTQIKFILTYPTFCIGIPSSEFLRIVNIQIAKTIRSLLILDRCKVLM
jgi:hypothetical protein